MDYQAVPVLHEELEKNGYKGKIEDLLLLLQKQTFQSAIRFFYEFHLSRIENKEAQKWLSQLLFKVEKKFEKMEIDNNYFVDNHEVYIHLGPCVSSPQSRNLYIYGFSHQSGYAIRCVFTSSKKTREKTFFFVNKLAKN